ncbi:MAG: hypothetical protein IJV51_06340 [Oscillospiraceae bacterium]|nr:hypothetical protein [Oscillospiraceae bacterium]
MNIWDILILLAVGTLIYFAVRAIRSGRAGSCHDCMSCTHNCAACAHPCPTHKKNDRP